MESAYRFPGGRAHRTNDMFVMIVGNRDEFGEDPAFILPESLIVSSPDGGKEFPFHRLSDFSVPEAASHLLGSILVEVTTLVG